MALVVDQSDHQSKAIHKLKQIQDETPYEEIYVTANSYSIISHRYQILFEWNPSSADTFFNPAVNPNIDRMRQHYWEYVAKHPAHTTISLAGSLPEAHIAALTYLKWCSSGSLS